MDGGFLISVVETRRLISKFEGVRLVLTEHMIEMGRRSSEDPCSTLLSLDYFPTGALFARLHVSSAEANNRISLDTFRACPLITVIRYARSALSHTQAMSLIVGRCMLAVRVFRKRHHIPNSHSPKTERLHRKRCGVCVAGRSYEPKKTQWNIIVTVYVWSFGDRSRKDIKDIGVRSSSELVLDDHFKRKTVRGNSVHLRKFRHQLCTVTTSITQSSEPRRTSKVLALTKYSHLSLQF